MSIRSDGFRAQIGAGQILGRRSYRRRRWWNHGNAWPWCRGSTVLLLMLLPLLAKAGMAQEVIDLDAFRPCTCDLVRVPVAGLGSTEGEGMVASDVFRVVTDPNTSEFAVVWGGDGWIHTYDSSGAFLRTIGRPGEGPGEIRSVYSFLYQDDGVVVHDGGNLRWLSFTRQGELMSEVPGPLRVAGGVPMRGDSVLIVGLASVEGQGPYPFHIVNPDIGTVARSFGSESGRYTAQDWSSLDLVGVSEDGTVLTTRHDRLEVQEWSFEDRHLRTWSGNPDWFPPSESSIGQDGRPNPRLSGAVVDANGRLWIKMRVAGEEWEDVVARTGGLRGELSPASLRGLHRLVLHVFDLERREYLGSVTELGSDYVRIVRGGTTAMFAAIEMGDVSPVLRIFRFEVRRAVPGGEGN